VKVFLAGEGKTELGRYALSKEYAEGSVEVGVLEALLRRHSNNLEVIGAELWKSKLPKLKVGRGMSGAETKTVRGLALLAEEAGAQVLVFTRDRDGDEERERDVVAGLAIARRENPSLRIVGGVAIEMIECWMLALRGDHHAQACRDPKGELSKRHKVASVQQMVGLVRGAKLERSAIPKDAESLREWLEQVGGVFGLPSPPERALP
jgi:hypothetical protein